MLGRDHSGKEALNAIQLSKEIFSGERVTFDLIFARPGQSTKGKTIRRMTILILTIIRLGRRVESKRYFTLKKIALTFFLTEVCFRYCRKSFITISTDRGEKHTVNTKRIE